MAFTTEKASPELIRGLEDIVGPEWVEDEPAILDGYCWGMMGEEKFTARPLAAVMPKTTKEIQAIVKLCNRHKVRFKAHSTGLGIMNSKPNVSLDLRRMNKIIDIDEKNMMAIVEPYCTAGSIIFEGMKKGVRVYHIGGGPSSSTLANCTSTWGYGTVNVSAGFGGRVPLAVEWVLPDGELLRMGSLGAVGEWFTGDGPGPSLRGVMRGLIGHMGGIGVFTRVAVKMVPYYGPPKLESYGDPPSYKVKIPDSFKVLTISYPSRDNFYEAMRRFQEESLVFWCSRRGPFTQAAAATGSNKELAEVWDTPEFQARMKLYENNTTIGVNAYSQREMDYKVAAVNEIMKDLGGSVIEESDNEITARFLHGFMSLGAIKGTFRSTGGMGSANFAEDTGDSLNVLEGRVVENKNRYGEKGLLLPDGDSTWVTLLENYCFHMETPVRYDPVDPESKKACMQHCKEADTIMFKTNTGIPGGETGGFEMRGFTMDDFGPMYNKVFNNIIKIKQALDPNDVTDSSRGISVDANN